MNKQNESYIVLALMSGTSLDGLDISCIQFKVYEGKWHYSVIYATTLAYSNEVLQLLATIETANGADLIEAHFKYGHYLGDQAINFINRNNLKGIDFIASHGHTIFHQPNKQFTFQLGHGAAIAARSKNTVISDFRSIDVALNGQGAPLVPIGDRLLYGEYNACINLGGIANISYENNGERIGFDICAVNMAMNHLCQTELQLSYDKNGDLAKSGKLNLALFKELNSLPFFNMLPPKSLGKESVFNELIPLLDKATIPVQDKLNTLCRHIADRTHESITNANLLGPILFTGGGALNNFLMHCIKEKVPHAYRPDRITIDYKEAIIFGLLGVLRFREEKNCLSGVTGARLDSIGGSIFLPPCHSQ